MKDFIRHNDAIELRNLGFNEKCYMHEEILEAVKIDTEEWIPNKTNIGIPLYSQAFRFFREKYNLPSAIMYRVNIDDGSICYDWLIIGIDVKYRHFDTHEDAELACLSKLIAIVKEWEKVKMFF